MTIGSPTPLNTSVTQYMRNMVNFTLTNTTAGSGLFNVPSDATLTGNATLVGYVLNDLNSGTCIQGTPCNLSTLQGQLAGLTPTVNGGTIKIGVVYAVNSNATIGNTITTSLSANITVGGVTSSTNSSTDSTGENVTVDARLDLQETVSTPGSGAANLTWTITANNGGSQWLRASTAVNFFLPTTITKAIAIFVKMPTYGGAPIGMTGTPTATMGSSGVGVLNSSSYQFLYSTAASPASTSDWTTSYNANATYVAVAVGNSTNSAVFSNSQSSSAGSVSTPQITVVITTKQPTACGATVTNIANSAVNGAYTSDPATGGEGIYHSPLIATGIAQGTADTVTTESASQTTFSSTTLPNTTPSSGSTIPGGASNTATATAYATGTASCLTVVYLSNLRNPAVPNIIDLVDFTLTNTGTASGNFNVASDFTISGNATVTGYVINDQTTGTCKMTVPCNLANLQTQLAALTATATNGTIKIGTVYTVTSNPTIPSTIKVTLTATITGSNNVSGTDSVGEKSSCRVSGKLVGALA